jgi:hypothetical protein
VTDQVSHPYRTTGKDILLCILIFNFERGDGKIKALNRIVASISEFNFFV